MKPLFIVLSLCLGIISNAFSQEIEWQNTIGGVGRDEMQCIQQTADGGYIIGGISNSPISGDKTEDCLGYNDYWILKLDSIGQIQWQNTIGGSGPDFLSSIKQTTDGGYILGGYSASNISGDKNEDCLGYNDYWVVKTDAYGNVQWQNTIGGSLDDKLIEIQLTADGGYILGGYSWSNVSGDKTENSYGESDYWIVKIDSVGNIIWQNTIGSNAFDNLNSICQTNDNGFILAGSSNSNIFGDKTENCIIGSNDYWIIKTDSLGNIQWQNTIGGSLADFQPHIKQTFDGGYIIGGVSTSNATGDKSENCIGGSDYWLVKLDSIGSVQWDNTIGGNSDDWLVSIIQSIDGGFYLGGFSYSNLSADKAENNWSQSNYWILKTDSLGKIKWQNTLGGTNLDQLTCIALCLDSNLIVGGISWSNFSGDKAENSNGYADFWLIKLTDHFNLFNGKLFADLNSDSIKDNSEPVLSSRLIIEPTNGRLTFSDQYGNYSLSVLDSGNFYVYPLALNLYNSVPAIHGCHFSNIGQVDSLNDFAFQPQGIFDEVGISIDPIGAFISGTDSKYIINYNNYGTTIVSPRIVLNLDNVDFQSANVMPTLITTDSVVWILPTLSPFQSGSITVFVQVDLGLSDNTLINSIAHIEPYLTDVNQSNNYAGWEVYTPPSFGPPPTFGFPFDPNNILVNLWSLSTPQLLLSPWLDYIINFQNTGTDTAINVKILNPIDTNKLNISTIEFVNSSHPVNLNWINYQRNMEFKFDNILLPDSNVNEPLSHGFVHYRIKPKSNLVVGDTIKNFAAIYFDFNEPVITNTAQTVIVSPTGLSSLSSLGKLAVYPNPAQSKININGIKLENGKAQLRLFDLYGKLILEKNITTSTPEVDVQYLPAGMYFLQSGNQRTTFVKQ